MYQNHENDKPYPPPTPPQDFYDDWQADGYEQSEYQPLADDDYEPPTFDDFVPPPTHQPATPSPTHHAPPQEYSLDELISLSQTSEATQDYSLDELISLSQTSDELISLSQTSEATQDYSLDELISLSQTSAHSASPSAWPVLVAEPAPRPLTTFVQLQYFRQRVTKISLQKHEWASDVLSAMRLFNMRGVLLRGDCGIGKTTLLTAIRGPLIFTAPTRIIIEQIAEKDKSFQLIMEGMEPDFDKYHRFATTYDSFPKVCAKAKERGLNPYAVPVIVDEVQHLSSDKYKSPQIFVFMTELRKFEPIIFTSATIPPFVPYFETFPIIDISRPKPVTNWYYVLGSETALIEEEASSDKIVKFHIDDKKVAEAYREAFAKKGYGVTVITADTKDEIMDQGLAEKRLPPADIYINTSVFNDGLSVHEVTRKHVTILSQKSAVNNGPFEMVQYDKRFRDSDSEFVSICIKDDEFDEELIFNQRTYQWIYKQLLLDAEETAEVWNRQEARRQMWEKVGKRGEIEHLIETADYLQKRYSENSLVVWNETLHRFESNLLVISQAVYGQLKRAAYRSRNVMAVWLSEHNYQYGGIQQVADKTEIDESIISVKTSLNESEREAMRSHIANFADFDAVRIASNEPDVVTSDQAVAAGLIVDFETYQQNEPGATREQYRESAKKAINEQQLKKKAAKHVKEMTYHLASEGRKHDQAFALAKASLKKSTLTSNAITRLKNKAQLAIIADGARDTSLDLQFESAFIREVLSSVTIGEPLDKQAVNDAFERGFMHSEKDRKRFTVEVKKKNPTEEDFKKAQKNQWQKRRKLLGDFFVFKPSSRTINGKKRRVTIPIKPRFKSEKE